MHACIRIFALFIFLLQILQPQCIHASQLTIALILGLSTTLYEMIKHTVKNDDFCVVFMQVGDYVYCGKYQMYICQSHTLSVKTTHHFLQCACMHAEIRSL